MQRRATSDRRLNAQETTHFARDTNILRNRDGEAGRRFLPAFSTRWACLQMSFTIELRAFQISPETSHHWAPFGTMRIPYLPRASRHDHWGRGLDTLTLQVGQQMEYGLPHFRDEVKLDALHDGQHPTGEVHGNRPKTQ